jgi:hypothetical protein
VPVEWLSSACTVPVEWLYSAVEWLYSGCVCNDGSLALCRQRAPLSR